MIDLTTVYDSFTFDGTWTIQGPLDGNLVAGLCIGARLAVFEMEYRPEYISITVTKRNITETIDIDDNPVDHMVTDEGEDIIKGGNIDADLLSHDRFGWWIEHAMFQDSYQLFEFDNAQFVQGFISICNAFQVDFRNYILGPPFKYDHNNNEVTYYNIQGYDIEPIPNS